MISDQDLRSRAMRVLANELGDVEAERFIFLVKADDFDYTEWQDTLWDNLTLEDIYRRALEYERKRGTGVGEFAGGCTIGEAQQVAAC